MLEAHQPVCNLMPDNASSNEVLSEQGPVVLRVMLQMTSDGIIIADREQRILFFSARAEALFGIGRDEAIGKRLTGFFSERHPNFERLKVAFRDAFVTAGPTEERTEIGGHRRNEADFPAEVLVRGFHDRDRDFIAASIIDVSERKALEAHLRQQIMDLEKAEIRSRYDALHDPLTGLRNRANFQNSIVRNLKLGALERASVMFLDLDRFKEINDTLGHEAGDELLRLVGSRLASGIRAGDGLFRLGGDEFTVLLPGASEEEASEVADRLVQLLEQPFLIADQRVSVAISIGIAFWPSDALDPTELLKAADTAMYRAKAAGGNAAKFFTEAVRANSKDHPRE